MNETYFSPQCWEFLLWLDPANHGGVKGKAPKDVNSSRDEDEEDEEREKERDENGEEEDDGPIIEMNWNMADFLPEYCAAQSSFKKVEMIS